MQNVQIPAPKNWQDFEVLCHALWKAILQDENTLRHGRQGQAQAGVDVYGTHQLSFEFYGIQSKGKDQNYGGAVTENELRDEVGKALTFSPYPPDVFILATTAPRDVAIQKVARILTKELRAATHKMKVYVYSWDDICERLVLYPNVLETFYPYLSPKTDKILYNIEKLSDNVSRLMDENGKPTEAQQKLSDHGQIKKYFAAASDGLLSWPRTLRVNNAWIDRLEEEEILTTFASNLSSTTILLGEPGSGKSALLSKIAQNLAEEQEIVLAIKADQLDGAVKDFESLGLALGLPGAVDECLTIAAKYGKVYLMLDQLDTLSEFVDVRTQRLSVLLSLVKRLSHEPNIHILASSRPFEFRYDARLSSIKAAKITLLPIPWETTVATLADNGVLIVTAEENFKTFLSRPSNLNFYLSYIRDNPQKHFQSHIELYEDIWNNSLGNSYTHSRRANFLIEIASKMTNEARQTLPLARYDAAIQDINWLCEAGILIKNNSSKAFSFAHQTLQAFAWTRSFVKENSSLVDFILNSQNNLNMRPKLTTVVIYLRDADLETYKVQLGLIFGKEFANIRMHVIHLLIDCLGAHHDPHDLEISILKKLVDNELYQARICNAISGKTKWFDAFAGDVLPRLMQGIDQARFVTTFILSSVVNDRKKEVLQLIDIYWKTPDTINFIYYVLSGVTSWDEELFSLACYVSIHPNVNYHVPGMLYQTIAEKSPVMAIKYAGLLFENRLEFILKTPQPHIPELPETATDIERYIHHSKHDPRHVYEKLMDFDHSWHNLAQVAQHDPKGFVYSFWNTFVTVCNKTLTDYGEVNAFKDTSGTWFRLSEDGRDLSENYLSTSMEQSIRAFALQQPDEYIQFYKKEQGSELLPVQRLLAIGLAELPVEYSEVALNEILSDHRYFKMGNVIGDRFSGSRILIGKISAKLNAENISRLENAISQYKARERREDRTVDGRIADMNENRRVLYLLLNAIPVEKRSQKTVKLLAELQRVLGDSVEFDGGYSGLVREVSPMTEEQMSKAVNEDIIKCFKAFPDSRMGDWPSQATYVGSTEFARTFEKFSEKFPDRSIAIMKQLGVANKNAIGYGLIGLSRSNITLKHLLELVDSLETSISGQGFYEDAARAISNKLSISSTLTIEQLQKLEAWIEVSETIAEEVTEDKAHKKGKEGDQDKIESVLWQYGRMYAVPGGNFQILQTLLRGYLLRKVPLAKEWSDFLVRYVNKKDKTGIWRAVFAFTLPRTFHYNSPEDNERVINEILQQYPDLLSTTECAHSFANSVHYVSSRAFFSWLTKLKATDNSLLLQVYGELLGIKWAIHPEDEQTKTEVEELIVKASNVAALCGFAFTLKNIWNDRRATATVLLAKLIGIPQKKLAQVLLGLLRNSNLKPSNELNTILDAFIKHESIKLSDFQDSFVIHSLVPLAHEEPHRVATICKQIIEISKKHLGDISTSISAGLGDLITIAITIHNLGSDFQKIGLDIFESLLHLDTYQVKEVLNKIDAAPKVIVRPVIGDN